MSRYISDSLRKAVMVRANYCCEYCKTGMEESYFPHQIDHIISIKHGGETILENLAYACFLCNNAKGSNIATILFPDQTIIRLFNPRKDIWDDHFELYYSKFYPKSQIGEATIKVLNMNDLERIIEKND